MAELAGRIGDGFIGTGPDKELLDGLSEGGRRRTAVRPGHHVLGAHPRPRRGGSALEWWPTAALHGEVTQELPNPAQFTDLASRRDRGPGRRRPSRAVRMPRSTSTAIRDYVDAGYDHVYLHQVGPDQAGFLEFAEAGAPSGADRRTAAAVR